MDWRETCTTVGERVFPGLSKKFENNIDYREVLQNLPLQMSLYFNSIFLPIWVCIIGKFYLEENMRFGELNAIIIGVLLVTVLAIEIVRLYLGYNGNLMENIPELAAFWLMSLMLQLPLQTFLLANPYFGFSVLEVLPQALMLCMLVIELLCGYFALKHTAQQQALYYKIMLLSTDTTVEELQHKYRD